MNSKLFFILLTTLSLYLSTVSAASAATITVNTLTDENNTNAAACSLREAINNANNDNGGGLGCTAGSGTDSIVIDVNGTITPTSALPEITTSMSITGNGASLLTITGSNLRRVFTITGGTVSLNNLTVTNGFDAEQAGAVYNSGTATTLSGVVVANSRSGQGGGVQNDTTMIITNSVIRDNRATAFGGGGILNSSALTVSGSTFSGNQSDSDSGAITNLGSLTVADSIFTGNSAATGGSAILHSGSSMSMTRSAFSGNLLTSVINVQSATAPTISNSTFYNNGVTAIDSNTSVNLTNCTISGNRSNDGGISLSGGSVRLVNNIVAGNTNVAGTAPADIQTFNGGSVNTGGSFNNIIGTGGAGGLTNGANGNQTNVAFANVRLLPPGNYGGLVQTMPIRTNSPARNAGRNTGAPSIDARGYSRPQGGTVDIGAFEIQTNSVVVNTNNSGTGSLRDTVAAVPANEIVQFETPLFYNSAQTISLSSGQISIAQNVTIYGTGANLLTVRNTAAASNSSRVFNVAAGLTASFNGISITGGSATTGGGGINTANGTVTVNDCYIYGNSTESYGAGIRNNTGTLIVNNTTISNNVANSGGGALNAVGGGIDSSGTLILNNATISGNAVLGSVTGSAAVYTTAGTITNSTITNNTVSDGTNNAGGIRRAGAIPVTVRNTIVAANVNNGTVPDVSGAFTSSGFNLIGNRGTATGFTHPTDQTGSNPLFENFDEKNLAPAAILDPNLLPLALNGAAVPTHAFNGVSPAIDKGNSFGLTTDARGLTRPVDLSSFPNAAGGDGSDIGAFEAQLAPTAAGTSISGRVMLNNGSGLVNATVYLTDQQGISRSAKTSSFGNYQFEDVAAGQTYVIVVVSKRYQFAPQILSVNDNIADLNFIAIE